MRDLLEAAATAMDASSPDAITSKLLDRARDEVWHLDRDIDWTALTLEQLGAPFRSAMSAIYSQLHFGELIALNVTACLADDAPSLSAKLFGATQLLDEARHVEFFSRVCGKLGTKTPVLPGLRAFAEDVARTDSAEARFLGVQVVLEGFAQAIFQEGARLARSQAAAAVRLPGSDAAVLLLQTVDRYVGMDESRHVAFGVLTLRERWPDLTVAQRGALEDRAVRWADIMVGLVDELAAPLRHVGISSAELKLRVKRAQQAHFKSIGLVSDPMV